MRAGRGGQQRACVVEGGAGRLKGVSGYREKSQQKQTV